MSDQRQASTRNRSSRGPIAIGIIVVAVVAGASSCAGGKQEQQTASANPTTADAGKGYYDKHVRYLRGSVTGYPDNLYYMAEIEINNKMYSLASVWTLFELNCGEIGTYHGKALLDALRSLAPIGTPVVAVRASWDNHLFVHTNPPNAGPTINEQLVRSGYGKRNPAEASSVDVYDEAGPYFKAVENAQLVAERERAGTWGVCQVAEAKRQAQYAAELAAMNGRIADSMARISQGGGDVHVDWGDGYCDTCRTARRIWNFFN